MKLGKNFSILFAALVFAALSLYSSKAEAQDISIDSTEVALILRDSKNAHEVAHLALNTVACVLEALKEEVEWTPLDCAERFNKEAFGLSQEHRIIHPQVVKLLEEIPNRRRS